MKYLRLRLGQSEGIIHPMHEFVASHEGYESYRLLQWNPAVGETNTMIFYAEGPPEPYAETLADVATVLEHEVVSTDGDGFYVYARERLDAGTRRLTDAFTHGSIVVMPPIDYRTDRTIGLTVVGTAASLQRALDEAPPGVDVDVRRAGQYDAGRMDAASALSERQSEALTIALERGYYETPREATVADVAQELDCAPGTAAEHLRKAEAALVHHVVGEG
ncbi:helix-turn-helix domain-containing protein [Halococcus qingdaonensis]|uniref:helix-turn-helix domain-containing protein n=1 Tax=Halococcus qingdaonensis TaxID=224402 RepID=UPI002116A27D|nr:helix-turn-helix domain-containing protein [Halococcus qingdaonensis]